MWGEKWSSTHVSEAFLQILVIMKNMYIPKKTAVYNKDHCVYCIATFENFEDN